MAWPVISRSGRTSTPGWCMSMANQVMPWCLGTSGSVRAISMPRSAVWPSEVHTFWPLTIHSSPSLTARVVRPARSEPAPGSLNSWHHAFGAGDDVADVEVDLLLGAVGGDGRRGQQQARARPGRRARRTRRSRSAPARRRCGRGPGRRRWSGSAGRGPAGQAEPLPPLADGEVGIPVLLEPGAQLVDELVLRAGGRGGVGHVRFPWVVTGDPTRHLLRDPNQGRAPPSKSPSIGAGHDGLGTVRRANPGVRDRWRWPSRAGSRRWRRRSSRARATILPSSPTSKTPATGRSIQFSPRRNRSVRSFITVLPAAVWRWIDEHDLVDARDHRAQEALQPVGPGDLADRHVVVLEVVADQLGRRRRDRRPRPGG